MVATCIVAAAIGFANGIEPRLKHGEIAGVAALICASSRETSAFNDEIRFWG
jgi:hypothetical protein